MRPIAVAVMILASLLMPSAAEAQITPWSMPRDTSALPRESHVTVLAAMGLPRDEFASTTAARAAFARPGAGLGVEFSTRFAYNIESGALIMVDEYPVDVGTLESDVAALLEHYGLPSSPLQVTATNWRIGWGVAKLGFAPHPWSRTQVFVDLYLGALYGRVPEFTLVQSPPGLQLVPNKVTWMGLAKGAGGGVRWRGHYMLECLYLSGTSEPTSYGIGPATQPVTAFHVLLGYSFGH